MASSVVALRTPDGRTAEVEVSRDVIPVHSAGHRGYDPDWEYVDKHGDRHWGSALNATLEWVVTSTYWCDTCSDSHEEGEYRCKRCGEVIEPGTKWYPPKTELIPGLTSGKVSLSDGSTYWLRGDEIESLVFGASGAVPEEWWTRLLAREPDEYVSVFATG